MATEQKDLEGKTIPVETDEEDKHYNIWRTAKLQVRFSDEAIGKLSQLKPKDQGKAIAKKVRIRPDADELLDGEYDAQSRRLVEAVRKGY